MGAEPRNFEIDEAESLIAWWREAGVDVLIDEAPRNWIGSAVTVKLQPETAPPPEQPGTLEAFRAWIMSDPDIPEGGPPARRVAPSGTAGADLMILTDLPDLADVESKQLMSSELGALFDKMLGALGQTRETVYFASLTPGRPPSGRIAADAMERLAEIARHHIALVAPKQLWLLGAAPSRAILGIDDAAAKGKLHLVNLDSVIVDTIATAHPRLFDGSKSRKAAAWAEMQRLMTGADA